MGLEAAGKLDSVLAKKPAKKKRAAVAWAGAIQRHEANHPLPIVGGRGMIASAVETIAAFSLILLHKVTTTPSGHMECGHCFLENYIMCYRTFLRTMQLPKLATITSTLLIFTSCSPTAVPPSSTVNAAPPQPQEERISMSAEELGKAFRDNAEAANKRFMNKIVKIDGTVQSVGSFSYPGGYIYIGGIKWETEDKEPWARVLPGQSVTLEGKFEPAGVMMKIIKVSGERKVVTAEQLATEVQANREATSAKYKNKQFEVQGTVAKVVQKEAEPLFVYLEGKGKMLVRCSCLSEREKVAKEIKPGDKARFVGLYVNATDEQIDLGACLPITK